MRTSRGGAGLMNREVNANPTRIRIAIGTYILRKSRIGPSPGERWLTMPPARDRDLRIVGGHYSTNTDPLARQEAATGAITGLEGFWSVAARATPQLANLQIAILDTSNGVGYRHT